VAYEWCIPVRGGKRVTGDLKMATSTAGDFVFIEKGHVYIDSSLIAQPNRCTSEPVTSRGPEMTAELRAALAAGEEVAGTTTEREQ
jgi:hypothetical protein